MKTFTKERLQEIRGFIAHDGGIPSHSVVSELVAHAEATIDMKPPKLFGERLPSRAEIAMHAFPVFISKYPFGLINPSACAQEAVQCADALLAELANPNEKAPL